MPISKPGGITVGKGGRGGGGGGGGGGRIAEVPWSAWLSESGSSMWQCMRCWECPKSNSEVNSKVCEYCLHVVCQVKALDCQLSCHPLCPGIGETLKNVRFFVCYCK